MDSSNDTALISALMAAQPETDSIEQIVLDVLPKMTGAFCLVFMTETALYAARDPHGVRPLVLGRLERGWVVASETAALDIVGATLVREVEPGEFIIIDAAGLRSNRFAAARRRAASSSTSTWPGPTPGSPAARCNPPGCRSDDSSPSSTPRTPT